MPAFRHKYIFLALLGIAVGCQPGTTDSTRGGTSNGGESSESISASDSSAEDPFYAHSHPWVSRSTAADADNVVVELRQLPLAQEPHNVQITRFVEHLASKGFQLRYDDERPDWQTTEPIVGEYVIRFNIGAFPPTACCKRCNCPYCPSISPLV